MVVVKIEFKIEFSTDASSYEKVHTQQQTFLTEKLLPFLVKNDLDFRLSPNYMPDSDSILLVKYSWPSTLERIQSLIFGQPGIMSKTYPDCEIPYCYEQIAASGVEKLKAPLFDRHGEDAHAIHCYCQQHLKAQDRAILRTIETVDDTPKEWSSRQRWVRILVWSQRGNWYAQRVQNDWDGDWEHGYQEYVHGSPWQRGKTREYVLEAARAL